MHPLHPPHLREYSLTPNRNRNPNPNPTPKPNPGPNPNRLVRIDDKPANERLFYDEAAGRERDVADYFKEKYPECRLQYPHLPCVDVKKKGSDKAVLIPSNPTPNPTPNPTRTRTPTPNPVSYKHLTLPTNLRV